MIFENSVIRIKAFELLHNNETLSENKIVRKLDDINQKECLGFSYPLKDNLEQDFNKLNKFYKLLFQNVESSLRYITRRTIVMDGNNKIDSLSVTVTMMVGDTAQNKVFLSNLFFLIENIDSLHSDFHPLIRRVERFIFEHPFCKQVDYSCLSKSDWNNNEVKKEWQVLNKELLKQFGVYLESQIQKYKKIKGE